MIKAANGIFFLYSGYILTTVICGALFYRERLTKNKILALIIALIGIFLFSYPFEFTSSLGMVFAMTAGVLDALNSTICKRLGSGDSIVLIFYRYLAGFVLAGIFLIFIREPISSVPPIVSIFSIIILGVSMFAIDSLWLYGFSHFDLNIGSIVTSVELVIAPVINALFIHEYPTKFELTGGLCIIMSIVLINTLVINQKRILKKRKEIYAN
jgi:drug/metabolite transporter (DMT)-like permease